MSWVPWVFWGSVVVLSQVPDAGPGAPGSLPKPAAITSAAPCSGGVFGGFAGFAEGGVAAGDEPLYESRGDGEGGGNLTGVEDSETAAGARSDVEEAAALFEAGGDCIDSFGNVGEFSGYCGGYFGVFFVDDAEHLEGGEFVDVLAAWVARFGGELG